MNADQIAAFDSANTAFTLADSAGLFNGFLAVVAILWFIYVCQGAFRHWSAGKGSVEWPIISAFIVMALMVLFATG